MVTLYMYSAYHQLATITIVLSITIFVSIIQFLLRSHVSLVPYVSGIQYRQITIYETKPLID